jgi:hypothetical protein
LEGRLAKLKATPEECLMHRTTPEDDQIAASKTIPIPSTDKLTCTAVASSTLWLMKRYALLVYTLAFGLFIYSTFRAILFGFQQVLW